MLLSDSPFCQLTLVDRMRRMEMLRWKERRWGDGERVVNLILTQLPKIKVGLDLFCNLIRSRRTTIPPKIPPITSHFKRSYRHTPEHDVNAQEYV